MIFILPFMIACSLLVYYHLRSQNRQRELLIENGINPDGISVLEFQTAVNLTNGILFTAIGAGFLLGYLINILSHPEDSFVIYLISIFIASGIGFIINYLVFKRMQVKNNEKVD